MIELVESVNIDQDEEAIRKRGCVLCAIPQEFSPSLQTKMTARVV